jgi:tetratricopeptide (TPR) repeat protein
MHTREEIESVLQSGNAARRAGKFSEALLLMNEAAAMCGPGQEFSQACVLRELGELARNRHDLSAAQEHYEKAVALMRSTDDQLKLAHTIRHLGDVHAAREHWAEAEQCFVEALDIYREHPSPNGMDFANAIRPFALLKTKTGRIEEARPLWIEAGKLYESEGIAAGVEECRRRSQEQ